MKIFHLYFIFLGFVLIFVNCDRVPNTCGKTQCPSYYRPVCATNGKIKKTFSNQCAVKTFNECSTDEKYNIIRKGVCIAVRD